MTRLPCDTCWITLERRGDWLPAERAGIDLDPAQTGLMEDLSRYYVQSRYPEEISALSRDLHRERGMQVLNQTRDLVQWLSSML